MNEATLFYACVCIVGMFGLGIMALGVGILTAKTRLKPSLIALCFALLYSALLMLLVGIIEGLVDANLILGVSFQRCLSMPLPILWHS